MNTIKVLATKYLRPSRTIETVLVSNSQKEKIYFIYNYEGYSFRVFETHLKLLNFFQDKIESDYYFESEKDLDNFLSERILS